MRTLLIFTLILTAGLYLHADGVEPDGAGTETDPYQVATLDNLLWMSTTSEALSKHYIQTADIDAADTENWNDGYGMPPIGLMYGSGFIGCYDGQNHIISNLHVTNAAKCTGMFGVCRNNSISNIRLDDAVVSGVDNIGCLIGATENCRVLNCHTSGSSESIWYTTAGGIVGYARAGSIIESCSSTANVKADCYVGGIVGNGDEIEIIDCSYNGNLIVTDINENDTAWSAGGVIGYSAYCTVESCSASGTIEGSSPILTDIGGLCGSSLGSIFTQCNSSVNIDAVGGSHLNGIGGFIGSIYGNTQITECYASGALEMQADDESFGIGGFAGSNQDQSSIMQCYCVGDISGSENPGGFAGSNQGQAIISDCFCQADVYGSESPGGFIGRNMEDAIVQRCYAAGQVTGELNPGGFAAVNFSEIEACFWNQDLCDLDYSAAGQGITSDDMGTQTIFIDADWDFMEETENGAADIWGINPNENNGFPFLAWQGYVDNDDPVDVPSISATMLHSNYPNPFNPETTISFSVKQSDEATLTIYNLRGQKVKSFPLFHAGEHKVIWDGRNDFGKTVASGVYLSRLESKSSTLTRKMMLMK